MLIRLTVAVAVAVAVGLFDGDEVEVSCKDWNTTGDGVILMGDDTMGVLVMGDDEGVFEGDLVWLFIGIWVNTIGNRVVVVGPFEGDLVDGILEIGQIAAIFDTIETSETIINDIITEYRTIKDNQIDF